MSGAGISAWTTAVGGAIQERARMEADKAVKRAQTAELYKQAEYGKQAGELVDKQAKTQGSESAKQTMAAGQAKREQAFQQAQGVNLFAGNGVKMNEADTLRTHGLARNRAVLGSYGDWALRDLISKIQVQNEMNKLYGQAEGQQNIVAPMLENDASHSADAWKMAGGAIAGAGSGVGAYYSSQPSQPSKAPTYVSDQGPWTSGSNEQYLQFNNVG